MMQDFGTYSIETPEQVALEFDLAGLGSRFMAVLLDHLIQGALILIVALATFAFVAGVGPIWTAAILVFTVFAINWGYFTVFETYRNGQTPGKKLVKIRVIKNSGRAITIFEAMIRNLVRVIDYLPTAYLVGMIAMFIDSKNRRLGDMAAGTLVVHEREQTTGDMKLAVMSSATAEANSLAFDVRKLNIADLELIETFLSRRYDLEDYARHVNAERLADIMRAKLGIDRSVERNDETLLEILAKTLRDTASFNLK